MEQVDVEIWFRWQLLIQARASRQLRRAWRSSGGRVAINWSEEETELHQWALIPSIVKNESDDK